MIIGIDIGTQSCKTVVLDRSLRLRGEAQAAYRASFPRPGWAEQAPSLWERAIRLTIAEALATAGATPADVSALGVCGQLDGCIATDAGGAALGPALIWMDRRAEAEIRDIDPVRVRQIGGLVLDPSHMAAKIRWLLRHADWARGAARFHQPVSYLVARMTGEHRMDHALASTTMIYSLRERRYDPALLAAFEIDPRQLPALADAAEAAGRLSAAGAELTGLRPGIPVAVGTGDDFSNPLGAGLAAPGPVACTLGTAEVVGALHREPTVDDGALVETHGYAGGLYFIENPGWLSGGAITWFADLHGLSPPDVDRLAKDAPPASDGLLFLPALSGAMAPEWHPRARGAYYGLSAGHSVSHMARAVLEGCAFAMRDVIERLAAMGVATDSILLLGGGAKSRLWAQIRADMTGRAVDVPAFVHASPLGAALLGAVAGGLCPSVIEGAKSLRGNAARIEPEPAHKSLYDAAYGRYRLLFESLKPLFEAP